MRYTPNGGTEININVAFIRSSVPDQLLIQLEHIVCHLVLYTAPITGPKASEQWYRKTPFFVIMVQKYFFSLKRSTDLH